MGDHGFSHEGHVGRAGEHGKTWAGGKEKAWTDCVSEDLRLFDPGVW